MFIYLFIVDNVKIGFLFNQVDDFEAFQYYPYRQDALLLHQVIWDYVREVLEGHYGKSRGF